MFGNKNELSPAATDRLNIIAQGTVVEGDLKSDGNLRIDGQVVGMIVISGNISVGQTGVVTGNITAGNAKISGKVKGNIEVGNRLTLDPTAKLLGDIRTKILIVEDGAKFSGNTQMENMEPFTNGVERKAELLKRTEG
jgi:cytoskeletal protein CcmA (bactofilin family)